MDLGRQRWSRFAAFLGVAFVFGVWYQEWLLVSVDGVLLLALIAQVGPAVGDWRDLSRASIRSGWPVNYPVCLVGALTAGLAAAWLHVPGELLMPLLALAAAHLLLPAPSAGPNGPAASARPR